MLGLNILIGLALAAPFKGEPFEDSPKAVLAAAEGADDEWMSVLHEEHRYLFTEDGRLRHVRWQVYQVQSADAAEQIGQVGAGWAPWHEDRPTVEARVITPAGKEIPFDPSSLVENSPSGGNPLLYSDARSLRAPLDKVRTGAIIETRVEWVEHKPRFAEGRLVRHWLDKADTYRLVVEVPKDAPLTWEANNLPEGAAVKESSRKGVKRLELAFDNGEEWPTDWAGTPPGHTRAPHLNFSTAKSWTAVADGYARMIAEPMASSLPEDWVERVKSAPDDQAKIRTAFEIARDDVRYTGLELGERSLVPRHPDELATTGYGDCKDKSTLIVSLLDEVGIEASVALVQSGAFPLPEDFPGIDLFNHAIVRVGNDLWLDPTASKVAFGDLPIDLQGRKALVIDDPQALREIPKTKAADNSLVETRTVTLPVRGKGKVVEHTWGTGWMIGTFRPFDDKAPEPEDYEAYVADVYSGVPSKVDVVNLEGAPGPVELTLEIDEAGIAGVDAQGAEMYVALDGWVGILPAGFWASVEEGRTEPYATWPFHHETRWNITPPPGMVLVTPPVNDRQSWGPMSWEVRTDVADDGQVTVEVEFDTGDGPIPIEAVEELGLWANNAPSGLTLTFQAEAMALHAAGDFPGALKALDARIAAEPDEVEYRGLRGLLLTRMGLRDAAVDEMLEARDGVEDPALLDARAAVCLMHDPLGRDSVKGLAPQRAADLLRSAVEAHPDDISLQWTLGLALLFDDRGNRWNPDRPLDEAVELIEGVRDGGFAGLETDLAMLYLRTGQPRKVMALLEAQQQQLAPAYIAAIALAHGPDAAIRFVQSAGGTKAESAALYRNAAFALGPGRHHELVRALGQAAESQQPGSGGPLLRFAPWEEADDSGPRGVALEMTRHLILSEGEERDHRALRKLVSKRVDDPAALIGDSGDMDTVGFGVDAYLDLSVALHEVVFEDPKLGARVRVGTDAAYDLFLVPDRGGWKVRAYGIGFPELAREAVYRLEKGDIEGGLHWLQWTLDQVEYVQNGNSPRNLLANLDSSDPEQLLWLARFLSLGPEGELPDLDPSVLPEPVQEQVSGMMLGMLVGTRPEADATLALLEEKAAEHDDLFLWSELARIYLLHDRKDDAKGVLEKLRARTTPPEVEVNLVKQEHEAGMLTDEQLMARIRELAEKVDPSHIAANEVAWVLAFGSPEDREVGHALARKSLSMGNTRPSKAWLHTVATLQVQQGDYTSAIETTRAASPVSDKGLMPAFDYVLGRVAEEAGLLDEARRLYQSAIDNETQPGRMSTAALAQRRLDAL